MNSTTFNFVAGNTPLLISIPHLGTGIPDEIKPGLTEAALQLSDTDWHLDQLYGSCAPFGATFISASLSRYVIDLNRPPDGASLYPGQTTTGLVPLETFHGEAVYRMGQEPDRNEIQRRVACYWKPYHDMLVQQIQAIKAKHGFVLLWEAHSINGELPRLFDGLLPDLNIGTFSGKSAAPCVGHAVAEAAGNSTYSWVLNGRFKGGYITRRYGNPESNIHAIQLEMAQRTYMEEHAPFRYRPDLAAGIQPVIASLLQGAVEAARSTITVNK